MNEDIKLHIYNKTKELFNDPKALNIEEKEEKENRVLDV